MTADTEDRSTWRRNGQIMRRDELLRLIEENGGPRGLDLRGAIFRDGDAGSDQQGAMDLGPEALAPLVAVYRKAKGPYDPPWLAESGGINLEHAHLERAVLMSVQLERAHLLGARLNGALLQGARLGWAFMHGVDLDGAFLSHAELEGADLSWAHLRQASLWNARLQGANLSSADLQQAILWQADLRGADLSGAVLEEAYFRDAQLNGAYLWGARLERVDMYDVASLDAARWCAAHLDHTRMRRESLGKVIGDEIEAGAEKTHEAYHRAKEAHLVLKNNFNQIGRYEDASWAYVKEQQMEKMAYFWEWCSHGWQFWRAWGSLWRWLRNWAYELLTGYGERVYMPVVWAIVIVAVFAVAYGVTGNVAPAFAGDPAQAQGSHDPVHALTHSVGAFATIGFNTLEPLGWGARLLTAVESALGISLFALFIFTLGNRMSRG